VPRELGAQILKGGAHLYGFGEEHFKKADAAARATASTRG
jgi:hypothetical protein